MYDKMAAEFAHKSALARSDTLEILTATILKENETMNSITREHLEKVIIGQYFIKPYDAIVAAMLPATIIPANAEHLKTLTVCVLVLDSGFTVVGTSSCVDPQNYNETTGRRIASDNAFEQLWQLEGYVLKCRMSVIARLKASNDADTADTTINPLIGDNL